MSCSQTFAGLKVALTHYVFLLKQCYLPYLDERAAHDLRAKYFDFSDMKHEMRRAAFTLNVVWFRASSKISKR